MSIGLFCSFIFQIWVHVVTQKYRHARSYVATTGHQPPDPASLFLEGSNLALHTPDPPIAVLLFGPDLGHLFPYRDRGSDFDGHCVLPQAERGSLRIQFRGGKIAGSDGFQALVVKPIEAGCALLYDYRV